MTESPLMEDLLFLEDGSVAIVEGSSPEEHLADKSVLVDWLCLLLSWGQVKRKHQCHIQIVLQWI